MMNCPTSPDTQDRVVAAAQAQAQADDTTVEEVRHV